MEGQGLRGLVAIVDAVAEPNQAQLVFKLGHTIGEAQSGGPRQEPHHAGVAQGLGRVLQIRVAPFARMAMGRPLWQSAHLSGMRWVGFEEGHQGFDEVASVEEGQQEVEGCGIRGIFRLKLDHSPTRPLSFACPSASSWRGLLELNALHPQGLVSASSSSSFFR